MLTDSQPDDSKQEENTWDPPSSSVPGTSMDDSNVSRTYRKKYRSKSAVSTDPRSPYYSSQGIVNEDSLKFGGKFTKAPSVSCVPGYDGHQYADVAKKSYLPFNGGIPGLNLSPDDPKAATIRQHYYPEGGWGYVVCFCAVLVEIMSNGLIYSFGLLLVIIMPLFGQNATTVHCISVGALSISFSMALSPIIVALSRKKSTRLMAILGGLVTALGMLFTSFASQLHQLFFSYGLFVGGGVSLTRDTAAVVVGQYFKRKREFVEIFVTSGSGISMAAMPLLMSQLVRSMGWRLGLQTITGIVSLTFVLGIFYRPASLYHPQRRAILHIKGLQKRSKAKDKNTTKEKPPFFDFTVLKSRTVQILISGSAMSAFGVNAPILLLMHQGRKEGLDYYSLVHLQVFMGLASSLGTAAFGFIVVKNSVQCLIARQYLSQASCFVMALALLAFINLKDYHGYLIFVWVYGFFYGGYQYSLKMFTFEKVRARNFSRAWGYLQFSLAIPHLVGLPLTGYLNEELGHKKGFYFASACISAGSLFLFLIDVHKRNIRKQKDSYKHSETNIKSGRNKEHKNASQRSSLQDVAIGEDLFQNPARSFANFASELRRQELTCISEEVVMENFLEDFMDDCITSCNKEEKYLMLSEYENNLNSSQENKSGVDTRRSSMHRKMSTVSPPLLEQCPSCLRVVPVDGDTNCQSINVDVTSNWRDQITTLV